MADKTTVEPEAAPAVAVRKRFQCTKHGVHLLLVQLHELLGRADFIAK